MPWQEVRPMHARTRFIAAVLADEDSITALCEEYRVSRRIAYKWLARYQAEGPAGLVDRSRAPHVSPALRLSCGAPLIHSSSTWPGVGFTGTKSWMRPPLTSIFLNPLSSTDGPGSA